MKPRQDRPQTTFEPSRTTRITYAELEFRRDYCEALGGPSQNDAAYPLPHLSTYEAGPECVIEETAATQKLDVGDHSRKLSRDPARILLTRRLNHDAEQLLGARRPEQDPTGIAQFVLCHLHRCHHLRVRGNH